jgi:hypothetical protein
MVEIKILVLIQDTYGMRSEQQQKREGDLEWFLDEQR